MKKCYRIFRRIVKKYIPSKTVSIRPKDKPWMSSKIRLAIRKRNPRARQRLLIPH